MFANAFEPVEVHLISSTLWLPTPLIFNDLSRRLGAYDGQTGQTSAKAETTQVGLAAFIKGGAAGLRDVMSRYAHSDAVIRSLFGDALTSNTWGGMDLATAAARRKAVLHGICLFGDTLGPDLAEATKKLYHWAPGQKYTAVESQNTDIFRTASTLYYGGKKAHRVWADFDAFLAAAFMDLLVVPQISDV